MKKEIWCGHEIRFVEKECQWWVVLKDVCDALGLRTDGVKARLEDNHILNGVEKGKNNNARINKSKL